MRRLLPLLLVSLFAATMSAQSADQEIVSAADAPDPVIPGNSLTYTITVRNNGPDPATNGGVNLLLDGNFTPTSVTPPAGWNCTPLAQIMTCNTPLFAAGVTSVLTITGTVGAHLLNFPDGTLSSTFTTAGVTSDPNNGNNSSGAVITNYNSPQIDLSLTVTDSPDPVFPDGTITYTVPVTNGGPDTATNVNFNVFNNNSLRFQSATIPAGWNCTLPAVGGNPTFTCNRPSFAPATDTFTVVLLADDAVLGVNDGTVSVVFSVNGTGDDTNDNNNLETEDTQYTTPDADMTISSATDSPDPVFPDGDITYTVTVGNTGPDTAPNASFSVFNNNSLRFRSAVIPAGWNCTLPSVDAAPVFSCTNPSFPNGSSSVFTIVLRAYASVLGINDSTVSTSFSVSSAVADPDGNDNVVVVDTLYQTPDANLTITASDAPDPVPNGANVTFTVAATNNGPDAAPNTHVVFSPDPSLVYQSHTAPVGWSCTTPNVGDAGVVDCQLSSLANGGTANFTLVTKVVTSGSGGGVLTSNFSTHSSVQDPNSTNNSVQLTTNWIGQTSDLALSKNTLSTAAAQGDTITYTLSTQNNGPDSASNVTVTDVLPPQLLFQSITAPAGWLCSTPTTGTNGTVTCTIAIFANGATASFTLVTTVAPNATGTISNSASIGFTGGTDPNPGNSSGVAGPGVTLTGPTADLEATKTTNATSAPMGAQIPYTITITNHGPDTATGAGFSDALPASLLFRSLSVPAGFGFTCTTPAVGASGTITCDGGTLADEATATFTLVVQVNASSGTIVNGVTVESDLADPSSGNSSVTTPPIPAGAASADVSIAKTTSTAAYVPGGIIDYTITVTNAGPSSATNVIVTDTLDAGVQLISATPSQGSCSGTTTITCNLGTLADDASATIALSVRAIATGAPINNTASVSATEDGNAGNNSAAAPAIPAAAAADAPTLSEWALIAMALGLAVVALKRVL